MSFLRFDQTTSDWVIMAPERARRTTPAQRSKKALVDGVEFDGKCPFCPGNEADTPPAIYEERADDRSWSPWTVRVIPNKFPVLRIEENNLHYKAAEHFRRIDGCGAHEVIVESPHHSRPLAEQPVEQIQTVLRIAQSRCRDLLRDSRFQSIAIFKNQGDAAGTTLRHPHWQLIATPVVPRLLRHMHAVATDYFDLTGNSLYRVLVEDELAQDKRILSLNEHFVSLLPYASHLPFECWILPRRHESSFCSVDAARLPALAASIQTVLKKLQAGLDNPAYNLIIDSAARGDEHNDCFSWHIRILPRITTPAGFELGSGMSINVVLPEDAAEYLRNVELAPTVLQEIAAFQTESVATA